MTEADTCRKHVVPLLQQAGWDSEPYAIGEQRSITDGRIVPVGKGFVRKRNKRVVYLLKYRSDMNLAVVEAKAAYKTAADGLQQAKDYAQLLDLKFCYATNGKEIIEFDFFTGIERVASSYPGPEELWKRYRKKWSIREWIAGKSPSTCGATLPTTHRYAPAANAPKCGRRTRPTSSRATVVKPSKSSKNCLRNMPTAAMRAVLGDAEQLTKAVQELQTLLYAA